jgi:hypothetical protein
MKEPLTPEANSVMVLSAAAATGHLRAADALVAAFAAQGASARHIEVLRPALAYKIDTLLADQGRFSTM